MNEIGGMTSRQTPILAIIPPPAQFALTFLVGIGLAIGGVRWAALALTVAGCSLAVSAVGRFVLRGTTLHPTGQPARLVVNGPHAWSRNPMYLSLTVVYVGLALVLARAWPLALAVLPWASMNWAAIPFEEARVRDTFGEDYVDYCRRVRRWI
jgi:protein-S-isoprenylcysteine O-methyltransferase Ste14